MELMVMAIEKLKIKEDFELHPANISVFYNFI